MLSPYFSQTLFEAGCDEAGRGCLAGPVVAAAVVLGKEFKHDFLDDSKKMSAKQRERAEPYIKTHCKEWAIGLVTPLEIDEVNILNASFLAMHRAIDQIRCKIDLLLIDGNRFTPYKTIDHKCIIKGDSKYLSIAAASVLAKNYRDKLMVELHNKHPEYDWKNNKGYPTKKHREAIIKFGVNENHRKSFQLLPTQLELNFN